YRREGIGLFGSLSERGAVCTWLIIINVACYILQVVTLGGDGDSGPFTNAFMLNAQDVDHGQVWRLITYAFLHNPGALMHHLFNMLFLFWFGRVVEDL